MLARLILLGVVLFGGIGFVTLHGLKLLSTPPSSTSGEAPPAHDWDEFAAEVGEWRIAGRLLDRSADRLRIEIAVTDREGNGAPPDLRVSALLERADGQGSPVEARVERLESGAYMIDSAVPSRGRWRAKVSLHDSIFNVALDL